MIDKCAAYIKELKQTANPKLWLDVAILDLANLTENTKLEDLQKRITSLESGAPAKMVNASAYNTPPSPVMKQEVKRPTMPPRPVIQDSTPQSKQNTTATSKPAINTTEEDVLNQSVPMSKPAPANGVKALWVKLLENITSFPSRAILKQQALPVKIASDEVIVSIKNPSWLKQFGPEGTKNHFIVEASNALFPGKTPKVIVRAPQAGDDKLRAESKTDDDLPAPAPAKKPLVHDNPPEMNDEEVKAVVTQKEQITKSAPQTNAQSKTIDSRIQNAKAEMSKIASNPDSSYHTDNVNMVMDLFEGKFIE